MSFPIARLAQSAAGRLTVRSALNPMLWQCGIVAVPLFALAAMFREDRPLMWALIATAVLTLLVTNFIALRFAILSPEKLQSEDYQLRHQSLQMLQGVRGAEPAGEVVDAVIAIANPVAPAALPPAQEGAAPAAAGGGGAAR